MRNDREAAFALIAQKNTPSQVRKIRIKRKRKFLCFSYYVTKEISVFPEQSLTR